jgi:hypothetical protein
MSGFSLGDAFASGFRLVGRRPGVILAWALAFFVLGLLPALLVWALAAPDVIHLFAQAMQASRSGVEPPPPDLSQALALQSKLLGVRAVQFLADVVSRAVLAAAVFRAVLEPERSRFAYLRLGAQELWLMLLTLAFTILFVIAMIVLAVPFGLVGALAYYFLHGSPAGAPAAAFVAALCVLGYVGVLAWILLRLSLAGPMTFAAREFRLFESWSLTRGHAGELFALALLLTAAMVGVSLAVQAVLAAVFLIVFGGLFMHPGQLQAFFAQPWQVWAGALAPWAALAVVVLCVLAAALTAVLVAPWAVVWRQLSAGPAGPGGHAPAAAEAQAPS